MRKDLSSRWKVRKIEEELLVVVAKIILSVLAGGFLLVFSHLYEQLILRPKGLRSKLQKQEIRGRPPSFLLGNILA
ncbi:hypothetical protein RchiOBHm_Chr4g0385671 [Rosa chinensis]|uniref:Uncharacterized protein n=1 Tax=Rosa chinensis TaxID=74649 RepID=A0A2P6QP07_ROSCH|nr:hypothetical protein RchiOBHm_Chr4g0385671 [Rosa chinensis]